MISSEHISSKHRELQLEIECQVNDFLSRGGKIIVCDASSNANKSAKASDFSINGRVTTGVKKAPVKPKKGTK